MRAAANAWTNGLTSLCWPPVKPEGRHLSLAVHVAANAEAMSRAAAAHLTQTLRARPDALLCLATGASPARTYELLAQRGRAERSLFGRARMLKLDEWGNLADDDPASCELYLREKLIQPLRIPPDRFFGWRNQPADPAAECRRVATWLAANGPIDVNVLGLGTNGHLGFNEPAAHLQPGPHVARLSSTSLSHSMLGGSRRKVHSGLTLGMADILHSKEIVLLVSGRHKAEPMRTLFTRRITPRFPVSFLWLHPNVHLFCDRAATRFLPPEELA
jgi:galactosamine-6-phosphate isomerase